jgi:hypothetical protein
METELAQMTSLIVPLMLISRLIFFQCRQILVIAYKSEFIPLAILNRIRQ